MILLVGPAVYLQMQYYFVNKGKVYHISNDQIIIYSNEKNCVIRKEDIGNIKIFTNKIISSGDSSTKFPILNYNFARIKLNDDNEIILTSLLIANVEDIFKIFENVKYDIVFRLFNTVDEK